MTFYHIPDNHLPNGAKYYFNVFAIIIGITQAKWSEYFPDNIDETWYVDQLTDSKPRIYHFYIINDIPGAIEEFEDIEIENLEIEILPHQVVEIHPTLGICLYDMLDFDTEDSWRID